MEEQYLQAGFEIKLACDALSRRILRWHWEKTPRPNTLKELLRYVERRTQEAPDYYANSAVLQDKTNLTWQQLDTTFCMRVMLDSEAGVAKPKQLLDYALQAGAARHACNGLRIARNAAAHATDKAGVAKAIATFDETLDDLERAYGLTLFAAEELAEYDALVTRATEMCKPARSGAKAGAAKAGAAKAGAAKAGAAKSNRSTATTGGAKGKAAAGGASAAKKPASQSKPSGKATAAGARNASNHGTKKQAVAGGARKNTPQPKAGHGREKGFALLAIVVFLAAFLLQMTRM